MHNLEGSAHVCSIGPRYMYGFVSKTLLALSTTLEDVNFQPLRTSVILGDKCNDEWTHQNM